MLGRADSEKMSAFKRPIQACSSHRHYFLSIWLMLCLVLAVLTAAVSSSLAMEAQLCRGCVMLFPMHGTAPHATYSSQAGCRPCSVSSGEVVSDSPDISSSHSLPSCQQQSHSAATARRFVFDPMQRTYRCSLPRSWATLGIQFQTPQDPYRPPDPFQYSSQYRLNTTAPVRYKNFPPQVISVNDVPMSLAIWEDTTFVQLGVDKQSTDVLRITSIEEWKQYTERKGEVDLAEISYTFFIDLAHDEDRVTTRTSISSSVSTSDSTVIADVPSWHHWNLSFESIQSDVHPDGLSLTPVSSDGTVIDIAPIPTLDSVSLLSLAPHSFTLYLPYRASCLRVRASNLGSSSLSILYPNSTPPRFLPPLQHPHSTVSECVVVNTIEYDHPPVSNFHYPRALDGSRTIHTRSVQLMFNTGELYSITIQRMATDCVELYVIGWTRGSNFVSTNPSDKPHSTTLFPADVDPASFAVDFPTADYFRAASDASTVKLTKSLPHSPVILQLPKNFYLSSRHRSPYLLFLPKNVWAISIVARFHTNNSVHMIRHPHRRPLLPPPVEDNSTFPLPNSANPHRFPLTSGVPSPYIPVARCVSNLSVSILSSIDGEFLVQFVREGGLRSPFFGAFAYMREFVDWIPFYPWMREDSPALHFNAKRHVYTCPSSINYNWQGNRPERSRPVSGTNVTSSLMFTSSKSSIRRVCQTSSTNFCQLMIPARTWDILPGNAKWDEVISQGLFAGARQHQVLHLNPALPTFHATACASPRFNSSVCREFPVTGTDRRTGEQVEIQPGVFYSAIVNRHWEVMLSKLSTSDEGDDEGDVFDYTRHSELNANIYDIFYEFLSGEQRVLYAGIVSFDWDGNIRSIDTKSGHYILPSESLFVVTELLIKHFRYRINTGAVSYDWATAAVNRVPLVPLKHPKGQEILDAPPANIDTL